jgi:hypothetical protein
MPSNLTCLAAERLATATYNKEPGREGLEFEGFTMTGTLGIASDLS